SLLLRSLTSGLSWPLASSPLDVSLLSSGGKVSMSVLAGSRSAPRLSSMDRSWFAIACGFGCGLWQAASAAAQRIIMQVLVVFRIAEARCWFRLRTREALAIALERLISRPAPAFAD